VLDSDHINCTLELDSIIGVLRAIFLHVLRCDSIFHALDILLYKLGVQGEEFLPGPNSSNPKIQQHTFHTCNKEFLPIADVASHAVENWRKGLYRPVFDVRPSFLRGAARGSTPPCCIKTASYHFYQEGSLPAVHIVYTTTSEFCIVCLQIVYLGSD
jgi:hypothetical protein